METLTDYAAMLTVILTLLSYSHSCDSNEHITYSTNVYRFYTLTLINSVFCHTAYFTPSVTASIDINRLVC